MTRNWRQKELVQRTGASSGLVSRVVKHLLQEGPLEEIAPKEYRLADWRELLAAWAERDSLGRRVTTYRFNTLGGDPHQWARALRDGCGAHTIRIAFTQWLAAWSRYPFTEPVVATAYVERPLDPSLLEELELREVDEAGKVWLHVPKDEGVFKEVREVNGLPLVTDAQIYLDLQRSGLRGPDQAEALFNWEEFCKP